VAPTPRGPGAAEGAQRRERFGGSQAEEVVRRERCSGDALAARWRAERGASVRCVRVRAWARPALHLQVAIRAVECVSQPIVCEGDGLCGWHQPRPAHGLVRSRVVLLVAVLVHVVADVHPKVERR
jgi:hypothetical protein